MQETPPEKKHQNKSKKLKLSDVTDEMRTDFALRPDRKKDN